jgi:N-acetylglutamate synthase-like GNAT family acetyltransferase
VTVRLATEADRETLLALWDEWAGDEHPPWVEDARGGTAQGIDESIRAGAAFVAERDAEAIGFAAAVVRGRSAELTELYVRPGARGGGVAAALVREIVAVLRERGVEHVFVATAPDGDARPVYERWGFAPEQIRYVAPIDELERRLEPRERGRSFGSIHVQTDDAAAVERGVRQFVPRLPGRSQGSVVVPPRNGWTSVHDELCDRDPQQLRRLARELSDRMGAVVLAIGAEEGAVARFVLFERGRVMDEYLSVREYYGPLPPGDVVALAANPSVVARLTGADRDAVRAAAVHADSPDDLPAPEEIVKTIAAVMGVEGAELDYAGARDVEGAVVVERA